MTDSNQLLFELETSDQSTATALEWIARSYESLEEWKKKAREVFYCMNGNSEVTRNRVAAIVRFYFVETPPKAEYVKRWKQGGKEIETIHVVPPKIGASNSAYVDWGQVADYLLLPCAALSEELATENQLRETEYRTVFDSFKIRMMVHDARTLMRETPNASESDLLALLSAKHDKAALAHIKEAKRLERANVRYAPPKAPKPSTPMPRYVPLYF
jgi:hypothetical protein